jgi:hypothetical protein
MRGIGARATVGSETPMDERKSKLLSAGARRHASRSNERCAPRSASECGAPQLRSFECGARPMASDIDRFSCAHFVRSRQSVKRGYVSNQPRAWGHRSPMATIEQVEGSSLYFSPATPLHVAPSPNARWRCDRRCVRCRDVRGGGVTLRYRKRGRQRALLAVRCSACCGHKR